MIHYCLEPHYLYVLRHHHLSISPAVHVYYANHVTLRKVWIVNKQRQTLTIDDLTNFELKRIEFGCRKTEAQVVTYD
jgi:hypothetical protein